MLTFFPQARIFVSAPADDRGLNNAERGERLLRDLLVQWKEPG